MRRGGRRLLGPCHRTIAAAPPPRDRATFGCRPGVLPPTTAVRRLTVGSPCAVTRSRRICPGRRARPSHRRRPRPARGLVRAPGGPGRRGRGLDDGGADPARRPRPRSGRGSRSRSTSRTTAPPSPASSGWPAERRDRPGSARPSTCRPNRTRRTCSTPSRRHSATSSRVVLVDGDETVVSTKAKFPIHDATQLVVGGRRRAPRADRRKPSPSAEPEPGRAARPQHHPRRPPRAGRGVVCDRPHRLAGRRRRSSLAPPARRDARLARRRRPAGHRRRNGRPQALAAFPDALLPYRPVATTDVPAPSLTGTPRRAAADAPRPARPVRRADRGSRPGHRRRSRRRGRPAYGSGSVTLLGFDPAADWIANIRRLRRTCGDACCRRGRSVACRSSTTTCSCSAVSQLPSLALPPIGGLILLLGAYILLIGPINYLVLVRLDRREWAWFTMPILIIVFGVGAYGFGARCAAASSS